MNVQATPAQRAALGRAIDLGHAASRALGVPDADGFGGFRAIGTSGSTSFYDAARGTAYIGMSAPEHIGPDGALGITTTTLHEGAHHLIRRHAGWPGLLAMGQPGILGEGLAQVIAGATLARFGGTDKERAAGWRTLDPKGQLGHVGRRSFPLSLTMDELYSRGLFLDDGGGVHVHGGIVQNAHLMLAQTVGLDAMLAITGAAMRADLHQTMRLHGWARATVAAAEGLHGSGSSEAAAVRAAWLGVRLRLE